MLKKEGAVEISASVWSYQMIRSQVPSWLAYALSFKISQDQEFDKVHDIVDPALSHEKIHNPEKNTIKFYWNEDSIHNGAPILPNFVYDNLMRSIL